MSAAVSRLRMIFDELLGSVETSVVTDAASPEKSLAAPPPSPESHSQQKQLFLFSPPKLKLSSSSPSKPALPEICFSFPSVTQEGRFGKVPIKSPPSRLPWQSNSFGNLNPEMCAREPFNQKNQVGSINKSKQFTHEVSQANLIRVIQGRGILHVCHPKKKKQNVIVRATIVNICVP